jgi:cytochrome c oxidase assembly factor CtaG
VAGRFTLALTWALPPLWIRRIWKQWKWKQAWDFLTRPVTAGLLHAVATWTWHMPRLYEASLHNEAIHFAEHISFFATAFLFWQVFADLAENARMVRSARFGLGIFMVFGVMLVSGFLGVLIAFSPYIWYPSYAHETIRYGLSALEDQQLAGTIMWVPSGVAYVAAALLVIWRWLSAMEAVENPQT